MQISFYVLGERFVKQEATAAGTAPTVDVGAVLNFVCRLTQTVLKKSEHSLVIIDDNTERLTALDDHLWSFDATSFIPHSLLSEDEIEAAALSAPVSLMSSMPKGFDGVVLNLAPTALSLSDSTDSTALPDRILEIITPDETSKQQGRDKYRIYRDLGFELIYFPIN